MADARQISVAEVAGPARVVGKRQRNNKCTWLRSKLHRQAAYMVGALQSSSADRLADAYRRFSLTPQETTNFGRDTVACA